MHYFKHKKYGFHQQSYVQRFPEKVFTNNNIYSGLCMNSYIKFVFMTKPL